MRSTTVLRRSTRGPLGRSLAATATVCLALSLAACSGDDDEPADEESSSAEGSAGVDEDGNPAPAETEAPGAPIRGCTATVELTGAVEGSWEGRATVRTQDPDATNPTQPDAVYLSENRRQSLSVYSSGEDFAKSVTYTDGQTTYASDPEDTSGIEARPNGRGATVETTLRDVDDNTADVVAEFTCRGGGNGNNG